MQRYFVRTEQINGDRITITASDAYHITRVMRFKPGDNVIACDNSGKEYVVQLETIDGTAVTGRIASEQMADSEPQLRVTLAQALIKGDKFDWVIQKGTEMGVYTFAPFQSERSVVKLDRSKAVKRRERWQTIAKEAAEQAHRGRIPHVDMPIDWGELLESIASFDVAIIPHERESNRSLPALWRTLPSVETCLIIIGPEGGFSASEVEAAREAGADPVHLGPRILRAETAALTTIACTMWASGEMEG